MNVAVAGFGVAGGALALLLARAGHHVTILERAPKLGPVGAGFLLQPSGQAILRQLGLLEAVAAKSAVIHGLRAWTHRGRQLVDLRYPEPGHAFGVHRGVLFEILHEAVKKEGVAICTGIEVMALYGESGAVCVKAADGTEHGPFDFVAACDGSRSRLRGELARGSRRMDYEFGALWGTGRCDAVRDYVHQVTHGAQRLSGLVPIGDALSSGGCTAANWRAFAPRRSLSGKRRFARFSRKPHSRLPRSAGTSKWSLRDSFTNAPPSFTTHDSSSWATPPIP